MASHMTLRNVINIKGAADKNVAINVTCERDFTVQVDLQTVLPHPPLPPALLPHCLRVTRIHLRTEEDRVRGWKSTGPRGSRVWTCATLWNAGLPLRRDRSCCHPENIKC